MQLLADFSAQTERDPEMINYINIKKVCLNSKHCVSHACKSVNFLLTLSLSPNYQILQRSDPYRSYWVP